MSRPRLLLFDKPLASLDLRSQQEVSQLVADLQAEHGFTVVLVTHDINPVLGVTDRVMYVAGGGVSVGPPEEVITSASLSRLYQADVEVLTDSRGRIFVVGLEAETAHPHSPLFVFGLRPMTGVLASLGLRVPCPEPGRWNLVADVQNMLSFAFMRNAFAAATASALVAGLIGYFVVLRASSFAAHAISHIGFAGAAGAVLIGVNPVLGVAALSLAASVGHGPARQATARPRRGDRPGDGRLAGAGLPVHQPVQGQRHRRLRRAVRAGLRHHRGRGADHGLLTSAVVLALLAAIYRPLLFASLDEEVAEARGIRVGAVGLGFMMLLALAVSEAVQVSGVLLIFALLVAPGAIAGRVFRRPAAALALSAALAILITWASLALAFYTPYPVSFYVTTLAFVLYLGVRGDGPRGPGSGQAGWPRRQARRGASHAAIWERRRRLLRSRRDQLTRH